MMRVFNLRERDIDKIMKLSDLVYGENYQNLEYYLDLLEKSSKNGISCSFVGYDDLTEDLIAYRLTYAPGKWEPGEWSSPSLWNAPSEKVCYFSGNVVHPDRQGQGIGSMMIQRSIEAAELQGGIAGVAHVWKQSPGNSAYKCFKKAGGEVVKMHENMFADDFDKYGTVCVVDGENCHCTGIEMIINFSKGEDNV